MNFFKKHPLSQSTVELAVVAVLVLVAMTAMGPYLVRSVNAYMRSWERRADQGQIDINVSSTPGSIPDPTLTCATVDCGDEQHSSQATCIGEADPLGCCIWVKEFIGQELGCAEVPGEGKCRTRGMPDKIGSGVHTGDGCHEDLVAGNDLGPCCGGLQWFWENTTMIEDEDLCDNKWDCTLPPDPCLHCNGHVCNHECEDNIEGCDCPDCNPPNIPEGTNPQYDGNGCEEGDGYCFWQEKGAGCCANSTDCGCSQNHTYSDCVNEIPRTDTTPPGCVWVLDFWCQDGIPPYGSDSCSAGASPSGTCRTREEAENIYCTYDVEWPTVNVHPTWGPPYCCQFDLCSLSYSCNIIFPPSGSQQYFNDLCNALSYQYP